MGYTNVQLSKKNRNIFVGSLTHDLSRGLITEIETQPLQRFTEFYFIWVILLGPSNTPNPLSDKLVKFGLLTKAPAYSSPLR